MLTFQGKTGRREFNPGLPCKWQEPNHLTHHHCLPKSASAKSWSQRWEEGIKPSSRTWGSGVFTAGPNMHAITKAKAKMLSSEIKAAWFHHFHSTLYSKFYLGQLNKEIKEKGNQIRKKGKLPLLVDYMIYIQFKGVHWSNSPKS